jgi:hypothetical protein
LQLCRKKQESEVKKRGERKRLAIIDKAKELEIRILNPVGVRKPEEEKEEALKAGVAEGSAVNHFSPKWERILEKGIGGLRDEARHRLASLSMSEDKKSMPLKARSR